MPEQQAPEYGDERPAHTVAEESRPVLNSTKTRQAVPLGRMRYVLAVSLALVIAGFTAVYLIFAQRS